MDELLKSPAIMAFFADLVRRSGSGHRNTERGAFLVLDEEGRYRCLLWPYHNGYRRERFTGKIPVGTIAVAHTHPKDAPAPSFRDQRAAKRLQMPFIVASPRDLFLIASDGTVTALVRNQWWMDTPDRRQRCEKLTR
ncbi:MAG: hypothetical protein KY459_12460 [Acidobacteria bacterium]|nr:hypothetical protein [Acidobacteriota bacterium]